MKINLQTKLNAFAFLLCFSIANCKKTLNPLFRVHLSFSAFSHGYFSVMDTFRQLQLPALPQGEPPPAWPRSAHARSPHKTCFFCQRPCAQLQKKHFLRRWYENSGVSFRAWPCSAPPRRNSPPPALHSLLAACRSPALPVPRCTANVEFL